MEKSKVNILMEKYLISKDEKTREEIVIEVDKIIKRLIRVSFDDYFDKEELYYDALFTSLEVINRYNESFLCSFNTLLCNILIKKMLVYTSNNKEKKSVFMENSFGSSFSEINFEDIENYIICKDMINKNFNGLRQSDKEVFLLYLKGYSIIDIGVMLNCSKQCISAKLLRIKKVLQSNESPKRKGVCKNG